MNYRGWTIEKAESAVQVGYQTPTGKRGKGRKVQGYWVSHPEHRPVPRLIDTLHEAKQYVDDWT